MKQLKVPDAPPATPAARGPRYRYFSNPPEKIPVLLGDLGNIPESAFTPYFDAARKVELPAAELLSGPSPRISLRRFAELVPNVLQVGVHGDVQLSVPASRLAVAYQLVESRELIEEAIVETPVIPPVEETFASLDLPHAEGDKFAPPAVLDLLAASKEGKNEEFEAKKEESKAPEAKAPQVKAEPAKVEPVKAEEPKAPENKAPEVKAPAVPAPAPEAEAAKFVPPVLPPAPVAKEESAKAVEQPFAPEPPKPAPLTPPEALKPAPKVEPEKKEEPPVVAAARVEAPVPPAAPVAEAPAPAVAGEAPAAPAAKKPFSFLPIFRRKVVEPAKPVTPAEPRARVEIPKPKKPTVPITGVAAETARPAAPIIPPPPAPAPEQPATPAAEIPALGILKNEPAPAKVEPPVQKVEPAAPLVTKLPPPPRSLTPAPVIPVAKEPAPEIKPAVEGKAPEVKKEEVPPAPVAEIAPAPKAPESIPVPPPAVAKEAPPVEPPVAVQPEPVPEPVKAPAPLVPEPKKPEAIFVETEHVPREGHSAEIPDQDSLQALFLTEDVLSVERVVELCNGLPGIQSCILTRAGSVVNAQNVPDSIDLISLSANALEMFSALRGSCAKMGIGAVPALTIHSQKGPITFFHEEDICLLVLHKDRGFVPGVREKLQRVVEELGKANLLLPVSAQGRKALK